MMIRDSLLSKSITSVIERPVLLTTLFFYYAGKSVTITWTIKWDSSVTLPTTIPIVTPSEKPPCACIIDKTVLGGGLAGVFLLLIITAGVAFHLGNLKGVID